MSLLRTSANAVFARTARNFCRTALLRQESNVTKTAEEASKNAMAGLKFTGLVHAPNRMEKTFLVWSGRYKSVGEIPDTVPVEAIEKARNKARIRIANFMMAATVIACIGCVISGKRAASRGESVQKENLDWHKRYNESQAAATK